MLRTMTASTTMNCPSKWTTSTPSASSSIVWARALERGSET
jgi:hypothetical protein